MGWNCNNCGHELKPSRYMLDQYVPGIASQDKRLQTHKVRHATCPNCNAQFLILQGRDPRIYLYSVMVCVDDGEGPGET